MKNIETEIDKGFLILAIKSGKITAYGSIKFSFLCPNCEEKNEYELNLNNPPIMPEEKCKKCGAEYDNTLFLSAMNYAHFK